MEPAPENDFMFITITYNERFMGKRPEYQFYQTLPFLWNELRKCFERYQINPELTVKGIIHYHIIGLLFDKIKWYKSVLPKLKFKCGFIDISYVKNYDNVAKYCEKDREDMKKILNIDLPITQDDIKYSSRSKKRIRKVFNDMEEEDSLKKNIYEYFLESANAGAQHSAPVLAVI